MAVKEELLQELRDLYAQKDFPALARKLVEINAMQDPEKIRGEEDYADTATQFFREFSNIGDAKRVPEEKRQDALALGSELMRIFVANTLSYGEKVDEWQARAKNGEIPEIEQYEPKEKEKLANKLGHDIALVKTEEGKQYAAAYSALTNFHTHIGSTSLPWRNQVAVFEFDSAFNRGTDSPTTLGILEKEAAKRNMDIEKAKKYLNTHNYLALEANNTGFKMEKDYKLDNGKVKFTAIPKPPQILNDIAAADTPEKLDTLKQQKMDYIKHCDSLISHSDYLASHAKKCLKILESHPKTKFKTDPQIKDKFEALKGALKGLTLIGSEEFMVMHPRFKKRLSSPGFDPSMTPIAIAETLKLANEYREELRKFPEFHQYRKFGTINTLYEGIHETLDNLEEDMEDDLYDLSQDSKYIGSGNITKKKAAAEKELAYINKAIADRGYSKERLDIAELNTMLGKDAMSLDEDIQEAIEAQRGVHGGGDDYNKALDAMRELTIAAKEYKRSIDNEALKEADRERTEQLREKIRQTQEKIQKYVDRKEKEKAGKKNHKLDAKGEKRLKAMKHSLKDVSDMCMRMDDNIAELDHRLWEAEKQEILSQDKDEMSNYADMIRQTKVNGVPETVRIGAAEGYSKFAELAGVKGDFNEQQMKEALTAFAKATVFNTKSYSSHNMTKEEYDRQINELAADPLFAQAAQNALGKISSDTIRMAGTENTGKYFESIMGGYMEKKAQAELEKQTEQLKTNFVNEASEKISTRLESIIEKSKDPNKDAVLNNGNLPASTKVQAAQTALRALDTLNSIAKEKGELDPDDVTLVRECMAALAVQTKSAVTGQKDPITNEDYVKSVKDLAKSPNFIKSVGKIDKDSIVAFLGDEKAPAKLMDKFMVKQGAKAQYAPDKRVKNQDLELQNEGIKRSNTIKPTTNMKI